MMGSEGHVFNKKLISGSMRTVDGAHMKMLCEGDINVDVITKNGDITGGTLKDKVIPGMKQGFSASHKQCWVFVDVITKNGDITGGTLKVKVIPGMKQGFSASHKQCWVFGPCMVAKQNKESFL